MKKVFKIQLFALFFLVVNTVNAQDYFEKYYEDLKPMEKATSIFDGFSSFDYSSLESRTLVIASYKSKISFKKYDLNKTIGKSTDPEGAYTQLFEKAYNSSLFSFCKYKIADFDIKATPQTELDKYLFLSFSSAFGIENAQIWYVTNGKSLILSQIQINGLDLGNANDLKLLLNLFAHSIKTNLKINLAESLNERKVDDTTAIKYTSGDKFRLNMNQLKFLKAHADLSKQSINVFIQTAKTKTLLVPENIATENFRKALDKDWSYSVYKVVTAEELQKAIDSNNESYYYLRFLVCDSKVMKTTTTLIFDCKNSVLMHSVLTMGAEDKFEKTIPKVVEDIKGKSDVSYDESTLIYTMPANMENKLPDDLSTSSVCYVKIPAYQYIANKLLNNTFENNIQKYPYKISIIDKASEVAQYKYRIYVIIVPFEYEVYKSTKVGNSSFNDTKTVVKDKFVLCLEDTKTKKIYCGDNKESWHFRVFRKFVNQVNKVE